MSEILGRYEIAQQLPCQESFIMVDVAHIENPGKIVGMKAVSLGEWFFPGHFPGHPIMPGVLQVEAFSQLAELLAWKKLDPARQGDVYMKSLNKVKFRRPNNPGDRIRFTVEQTSETSDSIEYKCVAENSGGVSSQAVVTMSVRPKEPAVMPELFNEFDKNEKSFMDVNQIADVIPHRYPFLLVDYVSRVEGDRVYGVKNACSDERSFRRYADGYTVMSGSVHPEIVAQAGCISVLQQEANHGKKAFFMAIDKTEFLMPVRPGDQLILDVVIPDSKSRFGKGQGRMLVNGKVATQSEIMFALVD